MYRVARKCAVAFEARDSLLMRAAIRAGLTEEFERSAICLSNTHDSTEGTVRSDAAVATPGEVEIELQPAGRLREEGTTTLVAPATVFNYGLSEGWEAVFALAPRSNQPDDSGSFPQTCPAARQFAG